MFQLFTIAPKIRKNYWAISEKNGELTDGKIDRQRWFYRTLRRTGTQKEKWKVYFGRQSLGAKTPVSQTAWIRHWHHTVYIISSVSRKIFEAFKIKIASCQTLPCPHWFQQSKCCEKIISTIFRWNTQTVRIDAVVHLRNSCNRCFIRSGNQLLGLIF